jgi:TatD DNase family protein
VYIDSHCHLNYLEDPQGKLAAAHAAQVDGVLCIGVEESAIDEVLALAAAAPCANRPRVWASVGEHPGNLSGDAGWVRAYLQRPGVVAVGEMGLDYFYEKDPQQQATQRTAFATQLQIAQDADLPAIIHTRDARDDTLALMRDFPAVRGVMHCFTESWHMAEQALEMGYYVSISGIVTFKNGANVREVAALVPDDRLLIETDAPWLAPIPHRGRKNEPAFVADTAQFVADLRSVSVTQLAAQTRDNFFTLFTAAV